MCHNFWTNSDVDPFRTSKWSSEPQFCERYSCAWQKKWLERVEKWPFISHKFWESPPNYLVAVWFHTVCKLKISYFFSLYNVSCQGIFSFSWSNHSVLKFSVRINLWLGSFKWFPSDGRTKFSLLSKPKRNKTLWTVLKYKKIALFLIVYMYHTFWSKVTANRIQITQKFHLVKKMYSSLIINKAKKIGGQRRQWSYI